MQLYVRMVLFFVNTGYLQSLIHRDCGWIIDVSKENTGVLQHSVTANLSDNMHGLSCTWVIEALSTEIVHLALLSIDNKTCISVYFGNRPKISICGSKKETLLSGKGRGVITWHAAAGSSVNDTQLSIKYTVLVNWCARLSPCLNGGTCIPGESSAVCVCPKTWQGKHCERETQNLLKERLPHTESHWRKAPLSQETSFHGIPEISKIPKTTLNRRKLWFSRPGVLTTFGGKGTAWYGTTEGQPREENNTKKVFHSNSSVSSHWPRDSKSNAVRADKETLPSTQETSHNKKDAALLTNQALSHIMRFTATDDPSLGLASRGTEEIQKTKPTGVTAIPVWLMKTEERSHAPENGSSSLRNIFHLYTLVSATFPISPSQESASQTFTVKPFPLITSSHDTTAPPDTVHNPTELLPPQHDQEMESNDRVYSRGTKLEVSHEMKKDTFSLTSIIPEINMPTKTESSQTSKDLLISGLSTSFTGSQAMFGGHKTSRKITAFSSTATLNYNLMSMLTSSGTDPAEFKKDTTETGLEALRHPNVSHLLTTPLEFSSEVTLDPEGVTNSLSHHQRNTEHSYNRDLTGVTENNSLSLQTVNKLSETAKYATEIGKEAKDFSREASENRTHQITTDTPTPLMEDFSVSRFEHKLVSMVTRSLPEGEMYNFKSKGEAASESDVGVSISTQGFSERAVPSSTSEEEVSMLTTLIESSRTAGLENSTLDTDSVTPHTGTTESTASTSEPPTPAVHSSPKLSVVDQSSTAEPSTLSITTPEQITVSQNTRQSASPTETFKEMSVNNDVMSSEDGIKSTSAAATPTEIEPTSSESFNSSPFTLSDTVTHYTSTTVGLDQSEESHTLGTSLPQEETIVPDRALSFSTPLLTGSYAVTVTSLNTGGAMGPTLQTTTSLNAVVPQTVSPRGEGSSPTPTRQTEMGTDVLSTGYSSTTVPSGKTLSTVSQSTLPSAVDDSSWSPTSSTMQSPVTQSTPVSAVNSTTGSDNVTESTTAMTNLESITSEQVSTLLWETQAKGKKNSTPSPSRGLAVAQSSTLTDSTYNSTFARHTVSTMMKTRPTAELNKSESTPMPFIGRVNVTLTIQPLTTSTIPTTTLRVPAFGNRVLTPASFGLKTARSSPAPPVMFTTSRNTYEKTERIYIVGDQPPIIKEKQIKVPSFLVLEMDFSKDLANPKSKTFENLTADFLGKVDPFYKKIPGYQHIQISGISGSVLMEYDAVFSTESVLGWLGDLEGLLNKTGLPEAVSQGFYIRGARVLHVSVQKRLADLCSSVFRCQSGFHCVPARHSNASCTSLCHRDYCENGGICTHQRGQQPVCQCPVGVDYWFMGLRCDHKMSQQKLIGIAFGVLLAVAVMMATIAFLVMRRFKTLLMQAKVDQTRSSYRRFSRFDDISEQCWSQPWLDSSANSLDNPAFTHSDELIHLRRLDSSFSSCLEELLTTSNSSKRNMPHVRTVFRHSSQYNWALSDRSINDHMADSGKASDLSVSSWPMEPIQWTPFPILQQLGIERPFKTRRPRSFCKGMELVNLERTWTA
ncbi:mucin-5AC-like [Acipenser oxyrinchus oxyrinchus]|uniref:Mucin-5AC-like n=1 Tax=Acipenser oxyrinchus oxyrinchus TaxID=40147 RepID=A0AAD8D752_ACIOX|nr:mucin-5AC-like [Acipenser oxyrinchus oxyrinchus]